MSEERIKELLEILSKQDFSEQEFEALLAESMTLVETCEENSEPLSQLAYQMGNYYANIEDFAKAVVCLQRSLAINREIFGKEHPYTAAASSNLGDIFIASEDFIAAADYYNDAVEIAENTVGSMAPFTVINYIKLATSYYFTGEVGKSIAYFTKAMVQLEDNHDESQENNELLGEVYLNLGHIYKDIEGERVQTIDFYEKSLNLLTPLLGAEHELLVHVQKDLEELKNLPPENDNSCCTCGDPDLI